MRWVLVLLLLSACQPGQVVGQGPARDDEEEPVARAAYVPARDGVAPSKTRFVPGYGRLPIFLNPRGGTYVAGADDAEAGTSSLVASSGRSSVTLPAWNPDTDTWDELTGCVREQLERFAVDVIDERPKAGAYIEVVFGGTGSELGLSGYASLAPIDAGSCKLIDRAVVFVFAQGTSTRGACEAALAGIGHAASLDHVMACSEPLSYLGGCGDRAFSDEDHACGETAERPCLCDRPRQNSLAVLEAQLGRSDAFVPGGEDDECGELTYAGECSEDDQLSWCDEAGRLRSLDCADAGLSCGTVDDETGRDCLADDNGDCGDIDFIGVCSEAGVLTYCQFGQLQNIDCASAGLECSYVDDVIGNVCTVPAAEPVDNCGGIDFFGECSADGTVLRYCSNGELRLIDCAANGLICGFESEEIGFDCLDPPPPDDGDGGGPVGQPGGDGGV